jgi:hypothetical protein
MQDLTQQKSGQSSPVSLFRLFLQSFTRPDSLNLLATLLVTCSLIAVLPAVLTPATVPAIAPYLAADDLDDHLFLLQHVQRMRSSSDGRLSVSLIGASSVRESVRNLDMVEQELGTTLGEPVSFHLLAASGLSVWEMVGIADNFPPSYRGIAVLGMPAVRPPEALRDLIATQRTALKSPAYRREASLAGYEMPDSGVYLLDYTRFFSARLSARVLTLLLPPFSLTHKPQPHRYIGMEKVAGQEYDTLLAELRKRRQISPEHRAAHFAALERAVALLQAKDVRVILMQPVANELFLRTELGDDFVERTRRDNRQFAEKHQLPFWDFNAAADLEDADFYDYCHLRSEDAMQRYTDLLTAKLSQALEKQMTGSGANL